MNNDDQNSEQNLNNNYPKQSYVGTNNVTSPNKANTISDNDNSVEQAIEPNGYTRKIPRKVIIALPILWALFILYIIYLWITEPSDSVAGLVVLLFGIILVLFSILVLGITIATKLYYASPKVKKIGFVSLIFTISVLILVPFLLIRHNNQPYSKKDVLKFIENCEIYNVSQETEKSIILNYKDKYKDYKTNKADPRYMDDYIKAAKSNSKCKIETHELDDNVYNNNEINIVPVE